MKIRTGFVSNSSSSSFVLAIKNDIDKDYIVKELLKNYDKLVKFIYNDLEYCDPNFENEMDEFEYEEDAVDFIADKIAENILSYFNNKYSKPIQLDNWKVTAEEFGTEGSDNLSSLYFYNHGNLNSDNIKIESCG